MNKGTEALEAAKRAQSTADEAKADLAAHKLWVAENYVSHTAMNELERRLRTKSRTLGRALKGYSTHPSARLKDSEPASSAGHLPGTVAASEAHPGGP
jgi:hypothetical protein